SPGASHERARPRGAFRLETGSTSLDTGCFAKRGKLVSKEEVGVTKRLLAAFLVAVTGTLVLATVGSGGTSKKQASPLPASSCAPLVYKGSGTAKFLIASDLPRQGAQRSQSTQMTQAIQFVLSSAKWKAGNYTIAYQDCDDS